MLRAPEHRLTLCQGRIPTYFSAFLHCKKTRIFLRRHFPPARPGSRGRPTGCWAYILVIPVSRAAAVAESPLILMAGGGRTEGGSRHFGGAADSLSFPALPATPRRTSTRGEKSPEGRPPLRLVAHPKAPLGSGELRLWKPGVSCSRRAGGVFYFARDKGGDTGARLGTGASDRSLTFQIGKNKIAV
jgi:hypothetical protein